MHIQLTVLSLLAMSVVIATGNFGGCLFEPCRQHLGVYYIGITLTPDITDFEVATFHTDGSFDVIDSFSDAGPVPSLPPLGANSDTSGVWECDGRNGIVANALLFFYPTPTIPRNVARGVYNLQFNGNGLLSGTVTLTNYDLASTANPDQSQWTIISGPLDFNLTGYKLFNRCGRSGF